LAIVSKIDGSRLVVKLLPQIEFLESINFR
jgi:hypothetical protein